MAIHFSSVGVKKECAILVTDASFHLSPYIMTEMCEKSLK
jgi:hypothetical protein